MKHNKIPSWALVILVVSVMVAAGLTGCIGAAEETSVSLSLHGPQASDGFISFRASLTGMEDAYRISLTGPNGTTVCTNYITKGQMDDCQHCCCLNMAGQWENPPTGEYVVTACECDGTEVLATDTVQCQGPDVQIESARFSWTDNENTPNALDSVTISVVNHGDVTFVEYIRLHMDGEVETSTIDPIFSTHHFFLDDTTVSLTASDFSIFAEDGIYDVTLELLDLSGNTVATLDTTIEAP